MLRRRLAAGVLGLGLVSVAGVAQDIVSISDGHAKLMMCSDLPCVEAMVDGKKLHLAIDTGNPRSVVNVDLVRDEGLDTTPYFGRDGKPVASLSQSALPEMKVGSIEFKNLPVVVAHLQHLVAENQMPEVDGTLGYEAFKGKVLRLDLHKNTIEVSSGGGCSGGTIALKTFGKTGPPIVTTTGFSVNGKPVVAQVDTLFAGSMVVYPDAVEKLGLTVGAKTKEREHFPFTDGGVDMLKSTAPQAFAGKPLGDQPVYFATPGVHIPDGLFEATVGMKLLANRVVTFDFVASCFDLGA